MDKQIELIFLREIISQANRAIYCKNLFDDMNDKNRDPIDENKY
jgi:hypothetical protein